MCWKCYEESLYLLIIICLCVCQIRSLYVALASLELSMYHHIQLKPIIQIKGMCV